MPATLHINDQPFPIGPIKLWFQYFLDDGPPHAWLDIHSHSEDARLGGVSINCLDIGDIPELADIVGRTLRFDGADDAAGAELSESVFWMPGDRSLEIESLELRFGSPEGDMLPLEIHAVCSGDDGRQGIKVHIAGEAAVKER